MIAEESNQQNHRQSDYNPLHDKQKYHKAKRKAEGKTPSAFTPAQFLRYG